MINTIMNMFGQVFSSITNIFTQIINATGTGGIILAFFFMFMVVRFIIKPFIGSRSNSTNSKSYNGGSENAS